MSACDAAQRLPDNRVLGIERMWGDPMGPCDRRDPSPQGREGIAEPGGRQVGPYGLRGRRHRLEAVSLATRP